MKVIAIGCDHAGYELKERLKSELPIPVHGAQDLEPAQNPKIWKAPAARKA